MRIINSGKKKFTEEELFGLYYDKDYTCEMCECQFAPESFTDYWIDRLDPIVSVRCPECGFMLRVGVAHGNEREYIMRPKKREIDVVVNNTAYSRRSILREFLGV